MRKEKIVIVNNNMRIGGVQRALVNMLQNIHSKYDITLLLFSARGELMNEIPDGVKVLEVKSLYKFIGLTKYDVKDQPFYKWVRILFGGICRIFGRRVAVALMGLSQRTLNGYDIAISYLHNAGDKMFYGGCNDFVLKHVNAEKKYAFLHCDYGKCGADTPANAKQYARFDRIAACSDGCRRAFVNAVPVLGEKITVVKNFQDYESIKRSADTERIALPAGRINILSVARLQHEKGITRAIEAIAKLDGDCASFHYYVAGEGSKRAEAEAMIAEYGLAERVTLLGELSNPYGYMKAADLLLMPSLSEAAPMVIGEAACLGTPVLTTNTTSAEDMVAKTGYGWVCENSVDGITESLARLLESPQLIDEKKVFLRTCRFDNHDAEMQFEELINSGK